MFIDFFCNKANVNKKVEFIEKVGYPEFMDIPDKGKMFAFKISEKPSDEGATISEKTENT